MVMAAARKGATFIDKAPVPRPFDELDKAMLYAR
jgi:hypothetical protein